MMARHLLVLLLAASCLLNWQAAGAKDATIRRSQAEEEQQEEADDESFNLFNASGTSLESQYHASQKLMHPTSTMREYRRGFALLEECSKGRSGRISADAMADLAYLHLLGSHGKNIAAVQPGRAFQYANQSAHLGSPRGRHLLAFMLRLGLGMSLPSAVVETDAAGWKMELLAAEQNFLPAMLTVAHRYLHHHHDCDAALRLYRAAANTAVRQVDATFYSDYASLRPLSAPWDELGDDLLARAARNAETIDYWLFHAERKDGRALFEIGRMYQLGLWGAHQNMQSAVEYYRRAAAAGHMGAQGELGRLLTIGHGCDLNLGFALKYLRQAAGTSGVSGAENGNAVSSSGGDSDPGGAMTGLHDASGDMSGAAMNAEPTSGQQEQHCAVAAATLGALLNRRIFQSEDADMAVRYLRQAASAGSMDAEWELGQAELLDGRLDAALQHFQRAEKAGHVRSMLALAQLYEANLGSGAAKSWVHLGHGKDQTSASVCKVVAKLYKRVAEVGPWLDSPYGPRQAMRELRAGRESEALLMYLLSAGEGYEIPHYNAAWMLIRNKGATSGSATLSAGSLNKKHRRHSTALQLLQTLNEMNSGHPWASLLEGDLHYRGSGTPRDVTAAAACYERSTAAGNVFAMERLAVLLMNGAGVRQDDQRAQQLIRHALTRVGQESSGLKGFAVMVKQAELTYRLLLMTFAGLVRAVLSGKWFEGLISAVFSALRIKPLPGRTGQARGESPDKAAATARASISDPGEVQKSLQQIPSLSEVDLSPGMVAVADAVGLGAGVSGGADGLVSSPDRPSDRSTDQPSNRPFADDAQAPATAGMPGERDLFGEPGTSGSPAAAVGSKAIMRGSVFARLFARPEERDE